MTTPSAPPFEWAEEPILKAIGKFILIRSMQAQFFGLPMHSPTFDDAALCALWNAGDRDNLTVRQAGGDAYLVTLDQHRVTPVTLNSDGTVEPKQS